MTTIDPQWLIDNSAARRLWLLLQAAQSQPFDKAIELARSAEAFLMGTAVEAITEPRGAPISVAARPEGPTEQVADKTSVAAAADRRSARNGLALAEDQRDRLLERLAEGARNAELAGEFGISAKKIQGFRMGCAREIARRRAKLDEQVPDPADREQVTETASIDDIVRYLRQQDDTVVLQEDGGYLVNGRFRLSAAELTARANRMRSRQRKLPFGMSSTGFPLDTSAGPRSHPLFWEEPAPIGPASNGYRRPGELDTDGA